MTSDDSVMRLTEHRERFMVRTDETIYDTDNDIVITIDDLCQWANDVCRVARRQLKEAQDDKAK